MSIMRMLLVCLATLVPSTMAQSATDGTSLYTALMSGYQKHVRPGTDYSVPLQVNVSFGLVTIQGFSEVEGKFSVTGVFTISWVDERLTWTPGSYNTMATTLLSQKEVWKPNMVLGNTYSSVKFLGLDDVYIRYTYGGLATWCPADVYDVSCNADVTFYPFDRHTCNLLFSPWFIMPTEVSFNVLNSELDLGMFTENSRWELRSTQMSIVNSGSQIVDIKLMFIRRYAFNVVNMILPMCLMTAINSFVFILPADSGERVGFSITNLLSIAVFLTIVTDALPEASQPQIPILCYLLLTQMAMSVLIMLLTILSLKIYLAEEETVPQHYLTFVNIMGYKCFKKKPQTSTVTPTEIFVTPRAHDKTDKNEVSRRKSPAGETTPTTEDKTVAAAPQTEDDDVVTWKTVGHAFDKASFWFIIVFSISINTGFMGFLIQSYF